MIILTGNPMSLRSPGNVLGVPLLLFLVALSVRMAVALWLPPKSCGRTGFRYERVAINLLEGSGFGSLHEQQFSVPTQPMLIAAVVLVFGKSYLALRMFFAVIGAATVAVGFALAKRLFGMTPAVIAGCLLVMYPYLVYLSPLFEYPRDVLHFRHGPLLSLLTQLARLQARDRSCPLVCSFRRGDPDGSDSPDLCRLRTSLPDINVSRCNDQAYFVFPSGSRDYDRTMVPS